jgi:replicative DNA helicase
MANQTPPHNIDAEAAVLGAVISGVHPNATNELLAKLHADDFYDGFHRAVYQTITKLFDSNAPIDLVTVMEGNRDLQATKLAALSSQQAMSGQFGYYCELIKEHSTRRKLMSFGMKAKELAQQDDKLDDIMASIERDFFDISKDESVDWEMNAQLIFRHQKTLQNRFQNKNEVQGVKTGFDALDELTSGWGEGQLIFLGAVPKMGKTTIALHFALNAEVPTLFFTLEMLPEEIADRQISSQARVEASRIKSGKMEEPQWKAVIDASRKLSKKPLGWVKKTGMTVTQIRAVCRRFQSEHGLGLVIIDQLDKIHEPRQKGELKTDAIGRVTSSLKNMARDLGVPVIVLLQLLDKQTIKRNSPRPTFGDIRDSSCPDQDGDVVMFLWRPEFYWPEKEKLRRKAEIIVSRQRSGATGSVWVTWEPDYTAFSELAKQYWPKEGDY